MYRQILRDKNGNHIGEIETDGYGVQIARDVNGNRVGTYDPRFNTTYDSSGCRIGEGNLLASLVVPQKHDPLLWGVGGYLLGRMVSNTASEQTASQETHPIEKKVPEMETTRRELKVVIGIICFVVLYFLFFIVYFKIFRKG